MQSCITIPFKLKSLTFFKILVPDPQAASPFKCNHHSGCQLYHRCDRSTESASGDELSFFNTV